MPRKTTVVDKWQEDSRALRAARKDIGGDLTYELRADMRRRERTLLERLRALRHWERRHSRSTWTDSPNI